MTIKEKLNEIENHYAYWVNNLQRKELTTNNVRIVAESICKAVILKFKGEVDGTDIILNKVPFLTNKWAYPLRFADLIDVLLFLKAFRNFNNIKLHLDLIRDRTNPSSHSSNSTEENTSEDDLQVCSVSINQVIKWFYTIMGQVMPISIEKALNGEIEINMIPDFNEKWQEFMMTCNDFDKRTQFILVSPQHISDETSTVQAIAKLPWRLVLDFNNKSDETENGLLYNFEKLKGTGYRKVFTIDDKPDFDPKYEHYWFLANGQGTIQPISDLRTWRSKYKKYLSETLYQSFNKGSRLKSRIVVMLNVSPNYADVIIDEFNRIDEANLQYVLCSSTEKYEAIFDNFSNVKLIDITPDEIAKGVDNTINFNLDNNQSLQILIPHKNENKNRGFIPVSQVDFDYLFSLGIEIVYKGIEKFESVNDLADDFYRGALVSWKDLYEHKDIPRNSFESLSKRLRSELEKNKLQEIEFVHEAGAGGTTIARRLAYDLSTDYPTVILRNYETKKTISALRIIYDQYTKGSLPLLIILELFEVREIAQLYRDLALANKNAVLLIVRRGSVTSAKDKKFTLKSQLDINEADLFTSTFSSLVSERKNKIQSIQFDFKNSPKYISPFVFGLIAYDGEFTGINQYIDKSLQNTTLEQKKLIGFICIIYHFTQRSVPAELFATLLGTDRSKCDLIEILGRENPVFELLHEEYENDENLNIWRPRYAILGTDTMKILLAGNSQNKENWETSLTEWLVELIKYIKAAMPYLDDETKQILNSLFIDRQEYDGFVNSKEPFTDLIKKIKPADGERIFDELTQSYENEAHFHGHYARYLYHDKIGLKDYTRAIEEALLSLDLQPNDSSLTHTLGMCYREQAETLIDNYSKNGRTAEDVEEEVISLVELSCDQFDICIDIDANNVYGHESQIRILLKALDFGFNAQSATTKEIFISNPKNEWYSKKLDKVSTLLEQALYVIEQAKGLENKEKINKSAGYIHDCEGIFLKTLGRSLAAKDKFENLVKNTPSGYQYMRPHYRRMYVMCLLASKSKEQKDIFNAWEKISEHEIIKCVQYLSDNIFEDALNTQNIRLWLQAIRYLNSPPTIEECISKVSTWTQTTGQNVNSSLEGYYYLYVLNAIKAINKGASFDPTAVENVKEIREKMKTFIKNEKFCFEWFGNGIGIKQMISHKQLGDYTTGFVEKNTQFLKEVVGRIKDVNSSQHGSIVLDCGLEAFFVPNVGGFTERNKNDRVKFYVGFRYDQIQAWAVNLIEKKDEDIKINITDEKLVFNTPLTAESVKEALNKYYPINNLIYKGVIKVLQEETALIESKELDRLILVNKKNLTNCKFNKLFLNMEIHFKVSFNLELPNLDKTKKTYLAKEAKAKLNKF